MQRIRKSRWKLLYVLQKEIILIHNENGCYLPLFFEM